MNINHFGITSVLYFIMDYFCNDDLSDLVVLFLLDVSLSIIISIDRFGYFQNYSLHNTKKLGLS